MGRQSLIDAVVAWLPLVVLIGVTFWLLGRSMTRYNAHLDEVGRINRESQEVTREAQTINRELIEIQRQTLTELREIKSALKDRNS